MSDGSQGFPPRDDLRLEGSTVLRRYPYLSVTGVEWIHGVLTALAATAFEAPVPVPHFDGSSVGVVDGAVWGAVSYVPGEVVGWAHEPGLFELGAFLARFHVAVGTVEVESQQSPAFPIDGLPGLIDDLARIGHESRPRHVIHGDFTNHNVLARGMPLVPVAAIDFANTYVEVPLADIGFALWRSGRPSQDTLGWDAGRIREYVDGYSSVIPLAEGDRLAVVIYLKARGVQMAVKRQVRGLPDDLSGARLEWLVAHERALTAAVVGRP
jgi:Ser/Thr protein kinase RdoA (MazF antagonist)